jgi:hypothetical protein
VCFTGHLSRPSGLWRSGTAASDRRPKLKRPWVGHHRGASRDRMAGGGTPSYPPLTARTPKSRRRAPLRRGAAARRRTARQSFYRSVRRAWRSSSVESAEPGRQAGADGNLERAGDDRRAFGSTHSKQLPTAILLTVWTREGNALDVPPFPRSRYGSRNLSTLRTCGPGTAGKQGVEAVRPAAGRRFRISRGGHHRFVRARERSVTQVRKVRKSAGSARQGWARRRAGLAR